MKSLIPALIALCAPVLGQDLTLKAGPVSVNSIGDGIGLIAGVSYGDRFCFQPSLGLWYASKDFEMLPPRNSEVWFDINAVELSLHLEGSYHLPVGASSVYGGLGITPTLTHEWWDEGGSDTDFDGALNAFLGVWLPLKQWTLILEYRRKTISEFDTHWFLIGGAI